MSEEKPKFIIEKEPGVRPALVIAYGLTFGALFSGLLILLRLIRESTLAEKPDPPVGRQAKPSRIYQSTQTTEPAPAGAPYPDDSTAGTVSVPGEARPDSPGRLPRFQKTAGEADAFAPPVDRQWTRPTKYIVGTGLFLAFFFLVFLGRVAIPIVIFAAIVAFLVQPVIRFFTQRLRLQRGLATIATYLLVVVVLILLPLILIPVLLNSLNFLLNIDFQAATEGITQVVENATAWVANIPVLSFLFGPGLEALSQTLQGISTLENPEPVSLQASVATLGDRLATTLGLLVNIFGPLVSAILAFVFMLMISLHMSLSGQQVFDSLTELIPPAYKSEILSLIRRIGKIWAAFLRGQLTLMLIIGIMVWLGNLVLGTPQALFLGIISGLLEVIPSLGPLLAAIPAVLVALIFGSTHFAIDPLLFALIVIAFYTLVQVLENQLVVPKVLGEAVDLPPLIVLLGVFIGGSLYGILGIFLATPVISSGREIFLYLYDKILARTEVEAPPEEKPSFMDTLRGMAGRIRLPFQRGREETPLKRDDLTESTAD